MRCEFDNGWVLTIHVGPGDQGGVGRCSVCDKLYVLDPVITNTKPKAVQGPRPAIRKHRPAALAA